MTIKFHFRPEAKLVVCVHSGTTPDHEFIASYKSLYKHHLFDVSMNRFIDLRQVDASAITVDGLQQLAEFMREWEESKDNRANAKVAVVAPGDDVFGLALKYEVFTDDLPWDFVVFHSAGAALAWLDLSEDFLDDLK